MPESTTAESHARRAVFLDRDGTIIAERHYLHDPAGVELLPGAAQGLRLEKARQVVLDKDRLFAVSVTALAIVDMIKGVDRAVVIEDVRIVAKSGGRSGDWVRPGEAVPFARSGDAG